MLVIRYHFTVHELLMQGLPAEISHEIISSNLFLNILIELSTLVSLPQIFHLNFL